MALHLDDDDYDASQVNQSWWVATPLVKHLVTDAEQDDAFFSKLGGLPSLLRSIERDTQCPLMKCTQCGKSSASRLLCQFYAPLEHLGLERVLYIVQCDRCSTPDASFVFVHRSTAFNCDLLPAAHTVTPSSGNVSGGAAASSAASATPAQLFEETDDWGDEVEAESLTPAPSPAAPSASDPVPSEGSASPPAPQQRRLAVTLASPGTFAPNASKKVALLPMALDVFEEPPEEQRARRGTARKAGSAEEQLLDAEKNCGADVVDRDSMEQDEESVEERCSRRYMERIRRFPSQCLRWCHSGAPLLCRADDQPPQVIPACDNCGAPRVFECELVSPAIFFLTKGLPEDQHTLHFGTVLIYTCSADCDDSPYVKEYAYSQKEI